MQGGWVPFLPKPTDKRALQQLRNDHRHGARIHAISEARRLRARLEDEAATGALGAEEGFSEEVAQFA